MAGDLLPYLKFYPAETIADERFATWTAEERGAWLSLLLHAWVNGSIPDDLPSLARISRVHPRSMERVWRAIGDRFVPLSTGRLTSQRLEIERSDARAKSDAGRSGARGRWDRPRNPAEEQEPTDATASGVAMPTTQRNATQINTAQRSAEAEAPAPRRMAVHLEMQCPSLAALLKQAAWVDPGRKAALWGEAEALIGQAGPEASLACWLEAAAKRQGDPDDVPLAYLIHPLRALAKRGVPPPKPSGPPVPLPAPDPAWLAAHPGAAERWAALEHEVMTKSTTAERVRQLEGALWMLKSEFEEAAA